MRIFALVLAIPFATFGQQSDHKQDVVDAAHRDLYQRKDDKKKAASTVTAEAAAARPKTGIANPSVVHRSYIDEQIFGAGYRRVHVAHRQHLGSAVAVQDDRPHQVLAVLTSMSSATKTRWR